MTARRTANGATADDGVRWECWRRAWVTAWGVNGYWCSSGAGWACWFGVRYLGGGLLGGVWDRLGREQGVHLPPETAGGPRCSTNLVDLETSSAGSDRDDAREWASCLVVAGLVVERVVAVERTGLSEAVWQLNVSENR